MSETKPDTPKCVGYGDKEDKCERPIDAEARALNPSELWCVECERARRERITQQMQAIDARIDARERGKGQHDD